jgi:hypothetical protein
VGSSDTAAEEVGTTMLSVPEAPGFSVGTLTVLTAPVGIVNKPLERLAVPVGTVNKPLERLAVPVGTVNKPLERLAVPVEALTVPVGTGPLEGGDSLVGRGPL